MMKVVMQYTVLCLALFATVQQAGADSQFFPDTGDAALYRHTQGITGSFNVLCLALQPGYEDLASLAYFKMAKGARIRTAYISNGEAGESDLRSEYPAALAALRRDEAAAAMAVLEGEAYFLNMPDIASARDSARVRAFWRADSLQLKLRVLIQDFKPDLILIAREFGYDPAAVRTNIVLHDVREAARQTQADGIGKVSRIAVESLAAKGVSVPVVDVHPFVKLSYKAIAETAASRYASLAVQRTSWRKEKPRYRVILPANYSRNTLDAGLLPPVPNRLQGLASRMQSLSKDLLRSGTRNTDRLLQTVLSCMDSVDLSLTRITSLNSAEGRLLLRWKGALDGIRIALLGVRVTFSVSETILSKRQLTYLSISDVEGMSDDGVTELYVPAVDANGWILNEDIERKVPFQIGKVYRLLSPETMEYDYPHAEYGIFHSVVRKPMYFFIIHKAKDRARSFVYRGNLYFSFSPKLTVEVLTPVVRATPGEFVVVRLTNHSRDGVRDSIYIRDSLVFAPGRMFRLSEKEATQTDSLYPQWAALTEGSHLFDVLIDETPQGRFVARQFVVAHDAEQRVAVVTGTPNSSTLDALRRIHASATVLTGEQLSTAADRFDVLLLDRRAFTLRPALRKIAADLQAFAERGGHLVILSQERDAVAGIPLFDGMQPVPSFRFDEETRTWADTTHPLLRSPNRISQEDFDDWVFRKAYGSVAVSAQMKHEMPIRDAASGEPLVVSRTAGKGRITYVGLALEPQWLNVHAGALRMLANIVSLR